jgi:hypothetical protein
VKPTVFGVFEDLKFEISEGSDQNWFEPSEILNLTDDLREKEAWRPTHFS